MALARPLRFDDNGWLVGVHRHPGPSRKQSGTRPRTTGMVAHSMEGWKAGGLAVLMGPRSVSWTGSIYQNGTIDQHYSFLTWCWHAKGGNSWTPGWEFEGRTGIPLTKSQLLIGDELYDAARDLMLRKRYAGWEHWREHRRRTPYKNLWEHNEVPQSATACPSERMIPLWPLVIAPPTGEPEPPSEPPEEGSTLSSKEYKELRAAIDGTNNLLGMVGEVVNQNSALGIAQQGQINFLITSLVGHHNNEKMHVDPADGIIPDEHDPEQEFVQDTIDEIISRLSASADALDEAGKGIVGSMLEGGG